MGRVGDSEPLAWSRLSRRVVYQNPWITVVEDVVSLPGAGTTLYGVVRCGDCVGALPFADADTVVLVQQWRYVEGRLRWEMPTGGVRRGESLVQAATRELSEEAGVAAGRLQRLTSYITSKSVMEETAHLFAAFDLCPAEGEPDETEFIRRSPFPFAEALAMAESGEIMDSMTVIALLWVDRQRRGVPLARSLEDR